MLKPVFTVFIWWTLGNTHYEILNQRERCFMVDQLESLIHGIVRSKSLVRGYNIFWNIICGAMHHSKLCILDIARNIVGQCCSMVFVSKILKRHRNHTRYIISSGVLAFIAQSTLKPILLLNSDTTQGIFSYAVI